MITDLTFFPSLSVCFFPEPQWPLYRTITHFYFPFFLLILGSSQMVFSGVVLKALCSATLPTLASHVVLDLTLHTESGC